MRFLLFHIFSKKQSEPSEKLKLRKGEFYLVFLIWQEKPQFL